MDDIELAASDFTAGFTLGYQAGYDHGRVQGIEEEGQAWSAIITGLGELWRTHPKQEEIAKARDLDHQPCATKCRRCSRCIHSLSWYSRGGRPFLGVEQEARLARGAA